MRPKILTVDDSKTVRIIVRKAFKAYDCEISEAANGVEGLAIAAKTPPDLILLDVTMPLMDGIEMLTKLKSDPILKSIPVIMLTAEGSRDQVLKVAKIGVRDYLLKPFKEDVLVAKAARIIDLKPLSEGAGSVRTVEDPVDILVVEDKRAIIQQIQEGLKHMPWKIHGIATTAEAIDFCSHQAPDLVIVSLSLPDEAAFSLFRTIRTDLNTKYTPVFALVVKTELTMQAQAQQLGFTAIITKPIDLSDLEAKAARALNLDTSSRYFRNDSDCLVLALPENCSVAVLAEVSQFVQPKLTEAVDAGRSKLIVDLSMVRTLHMGVIRLLVQAMATGRELAVNCAFVGNAQILAECKGFEETNAWIFHSSTAEAKLSLGKPGADGSAAPAAQAANAG